VKIKLTPSKEPNRNLELEIKYQHTSIIEKKKINAFSGTKQPSPPWWVPYYPFIKDYSRMYFNKKK
jgi:hypothetical protein